MAAGAIPGGWASPLRFYDGHLLTFWNFHDPFPRIPLQAKATLYAQLFDCEPMYLIGPDEVKKHHPLVDTSNIECALWTEGDGHIDPSSVTNAFIAKSKEEFGATDIFRDCPVVATRQLDDGTWEVEVEPAGSGDRHSVKCTHVINAAGGTGDVLIVLFRVVRI